MIAKILSASASFDGVRYNTDKIDKGLGELMVVRNFGALQGLANFRPEDYKNYLKMVSATNRAVSKPQFHAAISAKGRSHEKYELTALAESWLKEMGYSDQPYLVVFHKDTENNHVHVVSTRVDKQGKKIDDSFEKRRAVQTLNRLMGQDEKEQAKQAIEKALVYAFTNKAQFLMILESQGYKISDKDGQLMLIKSGAIQATISLVQVAAKQAASRDAQRMKQLTALLYRYAPDYAYLKEKHGIELLFHSKDGKKAYGYSIINHAGKAVYKGGDILPLIKLPERLERETKYRDTKYREPIPEIFKKDYYRAMLQAALTNFPDIKQGLRHAGIGIFKQNEGYYFVDKSDSTFVPLTQLLDPAEYSQLLYAIAQSGETTAEMQQQHLTPPSIAADIDDEAVHGSKRRKQKKKS